MKPRVHKEHHYYSFRNVVACKWCSHKSPCSTFGLLPKGFRLSPALVLAPTQQQLLPVDFSYLESLRFCGVDDQTGIKHPVGSCSMGCQQQQPLCPQQRDPLQPCSWGVPWSRDLMGNVIALQEISHSPAAEACILSLGSVAFTWYKCQVQGLGFLIPLSSIFMSFVRWSSHWNWLYFTPDLHCAYVLSETEMLPHIITFC